MNQSPYQHQDPLQIRLQHLIEQALRQNDQVLLARLQLQWVHRFGVDSLPVDSEEPSLMSTADSSAEMAPIDRSEPVEHEDAQPTAASSVDSEKSDQGLTHFSSMLKNCLDDVSRAVDSGISSETPPPNLRPVPAAGPQRLRRWLLPVSRHDLPKAS